MSISALSVFYSYSTRAFVKDTKSTDIKVLYSLQLIAIQIVLNLPLLRNLLTIIKAKSLYKEKTCTALSFLRLKLTRKSIQLVHSYCLFKLF